MGPPWTLSGRPVASIPGKPLAVRRYPSEAVVSFGRRWGVATPFRRETDVDLSLGRELMGLGLFVGLLTSVMWLLAKTRNSPR